MKTRKIILSYEPEADVLTWESSKDKIDYAEEMGNMIVHFSKADKPVLVEILEASKFLSRAEKLVSKNSRQLVTTGI